MVMLLELILLFFLLTLPACSGVNSEVKKKWSNHANTINIADLTSRNDELLDAGNHLHDSLEDAIDKTSFILSGKKARYSLKYKVLEFNPGNRIARLATIGFADSAKGKLRVKVALYRSDEIVGAWVIESWLTGGVTGGSLDNLFTDAAEEIVLHLKGDDL